MCFFVVNLDLTNKESMYNLWFQHVFKEFVDSHPMVGD